MRALVGTEDNINTEVRRDQGRSIMWSTALAKLPETVSSSDLVRQITGFLRLYRPPLICAAVGGCLNLHTAPSIPTISFFVTQGRTFASLSSSPLPPLAYRSSK